MRRNLYKCKDLFRQQEIVTLRTVLKDPFTVVQDILGNSTTVHHRLQLGVKDYSLTHLPPFLPASFDNSQVFSMICCSLCFTYHIYL